MFSLDRFKAMISRGSFALAPRPVEADNQDAGLCCGNGSGRYHATNRGDTGSGTGSGFSTSKSKACAIRYRATASRARYTCMCARAPAHALVSLSLFGSKVADKAKSLSAKGKRRYLGRYHPATRTGFSGSGCAKALKNFKKGEI